MKTWIFGLPVLAVMAAAGAGWAQAPRGDWVELFLKAVDRKYLDYTLTTTCADEDFAAVTLQANRLAAAATAAGTARELRRLAEANALRGEEIGDRLMREDAAADLAEADEALARAVREMESALVGLPECKPGFPYVYRSLVESTLRDLVAKIQSTPGGQPPSAGLAPSPGYDPYPTAPDDPSFGSSPDYGAQSPLYR